MTQTKPTSNEVNRNSVTPLTEPNGRHTTMSDNKRTAGETEERIAVQVGLWYETKGGCFTRINHDVGDKPYPLHANNGQCYDREGKVKWYNDFYDLILCLGSDPFKQVDDVVFATIPPKTGKIGDWNGSLPPAPFYPIRTDTSHTHANRRRNAECYSSSSGQV